MKEKLKIKRLYDHAIIPENSYQQDAGFDLCAAEGFVVDPGDRVKIPTGIALEIPEGYAGLIWDRSSLSAKYGLKTLGGVVDAGYRGEIVVGLVNLSRERYEIKQGDKVAQMLFQRVEHFEIEEVSELSDSDRSERGFGSSGK